RPLDSTQPSITATLPSTSPACPADPAASQPVDEAGQPSKHARQGSSGRAGLDEAMEELAATTQVPVSVKAEAGQTGPGLDPGSAANGVLGQWEGGPALPASALQLAPDMTRGKEAVKSELEKLIAQVPGLPMQAHGQPACTLTEQAAAGLEGQPGLQARAADDKGDKEGCLTKTCPSVVEVKVEAGEAAQPSPASLDSRASGAQGGVTVSISNGTPAMPQAAVPKPEALVKKAGCAQAYIAACASHAIPCATPGGRGPGGRVTAHHRHAVRPLPCMLLARVGLGGWWMRAPLQCNRYQGRLTRGGGPLPPLSTLIPAGWLSRCRP
ncbi:hypothetical protein HaLaN_24543, partial [Haematococcus lacustris]